jgi:hypothetical protein
MRDTESWRARIRGLRPQNSFLECSLGGTRHGLAVDRSSRAHMYLWFW